MTSWPAPDSHGAGVLGSVGTLLVALALAGAAPSCATEPGRAMGSGARPEASDRGQGVGSPAPEIVVERMNGKRLALSSLRGKVVLLDVWASWCGPCQKELPLLDGIARRLRGKGVEILAVSVDQERDNVVRFLDAQPRWILTVAHDPRGAIADALQPAKMPTSYAIDRNGVIRYINDGFEPSDAAVIEQRLTELAEQAAPR